MLDGVRRIRAHERRLNLDSQVGQGTSSLPSGQLVVRCEEDERRDPRHIEAMRGIAQGGGVHRAYAQATSEVRRQPVQNLELEAASRGPVGVEENQGEFLLPREPGLQFAARKPRDAARLPRRSVEARLGGACGIRPCSHARNYSKVRTGAVRHARD